MEDDYEDAQQAFLVGRYLKENGLSETLECFLKETPIKMVPKMQENMQSLPQILREFGQLVKDREELKESRRRMQQYEEILNLLFEELRDIYNFQSPGIADSAFTSADDHISALPMVANSGDVSRTTPERQFISSDFGGEDEQLIEKFCRQNLNQDSTCSSGRAVPVVLPKERILTSCQHLDGAVHEEPCSSNGAPRSLHASKAEGRPLHDRAQMLEHYYNRIREHRRINRRCKHRSKKVVGPDRSCITEPLEPDNTIGRAADSQSATCKESSPFQMVCKMNIAGIECSPKGSGLDGKGNSGLGEVGLAPVCRSNRTSEAKLERAGSKVEIGNMDTDGKVIGSRTRGSSFMRFDQRLGKEYTPSFHQHVVDWSLSASPQHACKYTTTRSSLCACTVKENGSMIAEDNHVVEGNCYDHGDRHVPCGGSVHYKAFLREKFFSTRRTQHNTIYKQKLSIHHHEAQFCDDVPALDMSDPVNHDDTRNRIRICHDSCTNADDKRDCVDVALLATETANLLERLLPLVADPGSMQTFISNIDTWSPRPSPRDHQTHNHRHPQHFPTEQGKGGTRRPQGIEEQTSTRHDSVDESDPLLEGNDMNDDASVLAELEEAVGRTVDDILRRHILISPAPALASAAAPSPHLPPPSPIQSIEPH